MFQRSLLREFLLTKLINAEICCYKAQQFSRLEVKKELNSVINNEYSAFVSDIALLSRPFDFAQLRTRSSLLESLQAELSTRSQCMMGHPLLCAVSSSESARGPSEGSGGFIENFKVNVNLCGLYDFTLMISPLKRFL